MNDTFEARDLFPVGYHGDEVFDHANGTLTSVTDSAVVIVRLSRLAYGAPLARRQPAECLSLPGAHSARARGRWRGARTRR